MVINVFLLLSLQGKDQVQIIFLPPVYRPLLPHPNHGGIKVAASGPQFYEYCPPKAAMHLGLESALLQFLQ
jgi:hypothetical protein